MKRVCSVVLTGLGIGIAVVACSPGVEMAAASPARPEKLEVEPERLTADYSSWPPANQKWFHMADHLMLLCSMPGPEHRSENPHDKAWIKVYVNDKGAKTMRTLKGTYPVGSVIVKEKRDGETSKEPAMFTVMTKRETGFNKDGGDWEYAVYDGDRKLAEKGKLERCMSCHAGQKKQDYVFANYRDDAFVKFK